MGRRLELPKHRDLNGIGFALNSVEPVWELCIPTPSRTLIEIPAIGFFVNVGG